MILPSDSRKVLKSHISGLAGTLITEKIIEEMIVAGIIKLSSSPYSSPVILMRKQDGGWRLCVDYKALNKVIVHDKFPIPLIDELFDELGGAKVFTKLDLIRLPPDSHES